jgi:hypothetical protein
MTKIYSKTTILIKINIQTKTQNTNKIEGREETDEETDEGVCVVQEIIDVREHLQH